eukprot:945660-Amorphochlora_amoeboformis.AAC.1
MSLLFKGCSPLETISGIPGTTDLEFGLVRIASKLLSSSDKCGDRRGERGDRHGGKVRLTEVILALDSDREGLKSKENSLVES